MLLQATGKQDASESRSASACKFSRAHFGSRGLTVEGIGLEDVRLAGSADSLEPLWASLRLWHHMIRLDLLGRLVTRCFRSLVIYGTQRHSVMLLKLYMQSCFGSRLPTQDPPCVCSLGAQAQSNNSFVSSQTSATGLVFRGKLLRISEILCREKPVLSSINLSERQVLSFKSTVTSISAGYELIAPAWS